MDNDDKSIMETEPFEMEDENTNMKRYMYLSDYSNTIYNSQDMEVTHVCINR